MLKDFHHTFDEVGTDEAGRGCLAGPVTAAAIILPRHFKNNLLNDSKQLSETKRDILRPIIEEDALCYGVAHIFPEEIDKINILNASILAMHKAIDQLNENLKFIIVDGNRFKPYKDVPFECIVKGDGKYMSIAAASVLAKTYRDDYMKTLAKAFPMYDWHKNKGYPTKAHRLAIQHHGSTIHHRQSFKLLPDAIQGKLFP